MPLLDHHLPPPALFALFRDASGGRAFRASPSSRGGGRPVAPRADRYFLHVRAVAADGFANLFQFALADDSGGVAVSVFVRGRDPVDDLLGPPAAADAPPPVPTITWAALDEALAPCRGAWIIAFGRMLHGSFLPVATRAGVASLDCARARFLKVARRRGLGLSPGDVGDLNDARRLIGLPPVRSADAAQRALGLRELWRWMDGV